MLFVTLNRLLCNRACTSVGGWITGGCCRAKRRSGERRPVEGAGEKGTGRVGERKDGVFCPREQLLSVPYATFPFSLMQTDWRNSAVHLGWSRAVSLLFLAADSRDTASFCFPKLIQPDSPAALNHRDDLRLGAALPPPLNFPRVYTHPPTAFCSLARSLWR